MDSTAERPAGHRRNRSAVLKSIMSPQRKRSPTKTDDSTPLGEIQQNSQSPSQRKSRNYAVINSDESMKSTKAAYNPFTTFSRMQEDSNLRPTSAKENASPPKSADSSVYTPIWAQFASQTRDDDIEVGPPTPKNPEVYGSCEGNQLTPANHSPNKIGRPVSVATKRGSKVMAAVAMFNGTSKEPAPRPQQAPKDLDAAFEAVLISRNIPEKQRAPMRSLDARIKADFIKNNSSDVLASENPQTSDLRRTLSRGRSKSNAKAPSEADDDDPSSKRSRSRGRTFTFGKRDTSTSNRQRSNSRPRSFTLHRNSSSTSVKSLGGDGANDSKEKATTHATPEEFVAYLKKSCRPQEVEIGKIHKLRLLLRNETVYWVDSFISRNGMNELLSLLKRIMQVEWREEHEDLLMHEVLLCLKGLCTTQLAMERLSSVASSLFPSLLKMLFDEERKGPSDFNTRGVIITLLFAHLSSASNVAAQPHRAREVLSYLVDPAAPEDSQPLPFIQQMHQPRPYQFWCRELVNVTKEVFWIFLHRLNTIPLPEPPSDVPTSDYAARHYPRPLPPQPAAPYVGGVEWDATHYLSAHLELMNGLLASLPTRGDRNALRGELRASGFEDCMGGALRTCKEKFYSCVHAGLKTWVGAAVDDGWEVEMVRFGPKQDEGTAGKGVGAFASPKKSPKKSAAVAAAAPPKLELPVLGLAGERKDDGWL